MAVSANPDTFELNLTPLLDVVLQLIMFFMMCINFVSEQVNQNVLLPTSTSAQELMAKTDVDVIVINVEVVRRDRKNSKGQLVLDPRTGTPVRDAVVPRTTRITITGRPDVEFPDDAEAAGLARAQRELAALARFAREAQRLRESEKRKTHVPLENVQLATHVIIRADMDTHAGLVLQLMAQCTKEGFPKVELRATQAAR
jgi:biopolymer transport protein ExbD